MIFDQLALYFIEYFDRAVAILLLVIFSLAVRFLLQFLGQRWITTTAHTTTLILLPILTYTITNVISGNIALSLGMVGALSIVRFRNPVRSPLELSVYFGAITMGIVASVSLKWLLFLAISVLFAVFILLLTHLYFKYFLKTSFFNASFSEGNSMSTLEIITIKEKGFLEDSEFLTIKRLIDKQYEYVLSSQNFESLKTIHSSLQNDEEVISFQLTK